jgi:hypothetical protein
MRKRTVITEEVEGIEVELDFEPVFGEVLKERVGDKIIVAYLAQDFDPENPMTAWDGEGALYTKPERWGGGSITDDSEWGSHLGLDHYGEPDLELADVTERATENLRAVIGKDQDFIDWCLEEFEEFSSIEDCFDTIDFDYDRFPMWLHTMWERYLEPAWDELYAEGVIGDYLAVPVNYCSNNHGPGTASAHTASVDNCNAVWVPGKNEIDNMTFPENATYLEKFAVAEKYAKGCLDTYIYWCNGEVYGCVVQTHDALTGEQLDVDSCWGYYGYDSAIKLLKSELFDPAIEHYLKEVEHA